MTHTKNNSNGNRPKVQLVYDPRDVVKVIDLLPRDPILDLMENPGPGRKLSALEPILRVYHLSQMKETWVPKKPHTVHGLLKKDHRNLAALCGFEKIPCWETFRNRFKLLETQYGNETAIRQAEILMKLQKMDWGKKALPVITKRKLPRKKNADGRRSNYQHRKQRIQNALGVFELAELAGTEESAEDFFIMARWPNGKITCPLSGCGSDHILDLPSNQCRQWLCLECEEPFDVKTATTFEDTKFSLRTILWATYCLLQIPFGLSALTLACLLKDDDGRRLSNKAVLDLTHRIQTALKEPDPRLAGPVQIDDSLMGYAKGVRVNIIGGVDSKTGWACAEPIYGPVNRINSSRFIDRVVELFAKIFTDSAQNYAEHLRRRQKVNHGRRQFARDGEEEGERVSTNLVENFWSTFQELLDRRRAVTAHYLLLYLAEHLWRCNHASEPTVVQLQAFIRNAHDVVLRGDDKPDPDERSVEKELALQLKLKLDAAHEKEPKARAKRSRPSRRKKGSSQKKLF